MPVQHRIPHDLDLDLARRVTAKALEAYRAQFPQFRPTGEWVTPDHARIAFSPPGATLRGELRVHPRHIDLTLEVPLLFRPFRKQAIQVIEAEVKEWIDKAKAGALDDPAG